MRRVRTSRMPRLRVASGLRKKIPLFRAETEFKWRAYTFVLTLQSILRERLNVFVRCILCPRELSAFSRSVKGAAAHSVGLHAARARGRLPLCGGGAGRRSVENRHGKCAA